MQFEILHRLHTNSLTFSIAFIMYNTEGKKILKLCTLVKVEQKEKDGNKSHQVK